MDHSDVNKKDFQEARTKPPKVRHEGSGDSAAFLCVLCKWLLSIPYQSYCGDRACYNCLKLLAQKIKQSGRETIRCPGCGEEIIPDQFFPDKAVTRELNALHVACPNKGCSWEGQYCDYQDHFNECPQCDQYAVQCTEGHEENVGRNLELMKTHVNEDCAMVGRTCHYQVVGCKCEDHWEMCDQYPVLCSEGCGEKVPRRLTLQQATGLDASVTEDAITKLQHAVKELQDYYNNLALSVQAMPATSYIWKVPELTRKRRDAVLGKTISLYSAPFFTSRHGYKLCLRLCLNGDGSGQGTHVSFFITLMKGEFDPLLPWPFKQTVSLSLLAQDGMSRDITQSFKPDEGSGSFLMPKSEMNIASGCPKFCSLAVLENPAYARADTIYLKGAISLQGIEHIP